MQYFPGLKPGATLTGYVIMSFIKIWIHAIWATKKRYPFLINKLRKQLFKHIIKNADNKGIHINVINGYYDHVHLLISMNADQSISKIIHYIKGESSFWINSNNLTDVKFAWQSDYYAVAISHQQIKSVRDYIINQEKHHYSESFEDEIKQFIK